MSKEQIKETPGLQREASEEDKSEEETLDLLKEEAEAEDRYVWHDEQGYKKTLHRGAIALVVAAVAGLAFYIPLRQYTDAWQFAIGLFVIVLLIAIGIFHKRMTNNTATFIRYDGSLYRMSSANRGLTRIALDNTADAPDFLKDFHKAMDTDSCWQILQAELIEEDKRGWQITAKVTKYHSDKEAHVSFFVEKGYNDMDALLAEFAERKA